MKAVEYYLKGAFATSAASKELLAIAEFTHFACTSEDVSNLAYSCLVSEARQHVVLPLMHDVVDSIAHLAWDLADMPLLARTHGQPATPTTMGKELVNFAHRLDSAAAAVARTPIRGACVLRVARLSCDPPFAGVRVSSHPPPRSSGKFNGAVGSYNAHVAAYPLVPWEAVSRTLVEGHLGLSYSALTTQACRAQPLCSRAPSCATAASPAAD